MELLPVVCLCLLTRCGITSADANETVVVTVEEGENALLPCSLSTKENIEQGHFDWNKVAQNNEKKEVFLYLKGKHSNTGYGSQDDGFKGRVSHFPQELEHGNASIIISNTKVADSGDYTCDFTEPRETFYIKLVVDCVLKDRTPDKKPGTCPKPNLRILRPADDGMLLQCEVRGAFPKPKVELKDSSGNKLSADDPQVTDRGDLYDIILQTTVTKTDNYSCVSTQEAICHEISADTYVPVNGPTDISVYEGDDVTLPCSLSTKENIESEMFEWKKDGQKVFLYDAGITYNNGRAGQSEEFIGRVFHYPHKLKRGDASITIRNTKMTDSGNYTCVFPRLQPRQPFHIELEVVNSGSGANSPGSTGLVVGIVILLLLLLLAIILAAVFCIKQKPNKGSPVPQGEQNV